MRAHLIFKVLVASFALAVSIPAQKAVSDEVFVESIKPMLVESCVVCHGGETPEAGLDFTKIAENPAALKGAEAVRASMLTRLARGDMPPAGFARPDGAKLKSTLAWLTAADSRGVAAWEGRVTLRRLSKVEYVNSVHDLLGTDLDFAHELPEDSAGHGFDNNGDALNLPPLLLEKFAMVADRLARAAIVDENPLNPPRRRFEAEEMDNTLDTERKNKGKGPVVVLFTRGRLSVTVDIPRDGDYILRAKVFATQAGPEDASMDFEFDHVREHEVKVLATKAKPQVMEVPMRLLGGRHKVGVGFFNDFYDEKAPADKRDRNLYVDWFELEGPVDPPTPTPFQQELMRDDQQGSPDLRAKRVLAPFLRRAWRRPPDPTSLGRVAGLVSEAVTRGESFEGGLRIAIAAVLASPRFLFRLETDAKESPIGSLRDLDGFEMATRLSYFIWSTTPDEALLAAATQGELATVEGLLRQVERMMKDARASALATNFAAQWLELRSLSDAAPDPTRYGTFDEPLRRAMQRESELLFEAIMREGRDVAELLTADFTFVNEVLARHYGMPGVRGEEFRRVSVADLRRRGLLGHASLHVMTSNPTRTSPVKRGKWLLSNLLDAPPPPPPPGVGALDESPAIAANAPLKERLASHRTNPSCASCHVQMDAMGFALENFDPVGRWRERDEHHPVDASGSLPDGRKIEGPIALRRVLLEGTAFRRAVLKKLMIYALGRGPAPADEVAIDRFLGSAPPWATVTDLIRAVVVMDTFRKKRVG